MTVQRCNSENVSAIQFDQAIRGVFGAKVNLG
jgi:hypothetical protein